MANLFIQTCKNRLRAFKFAGQGIVSFMRSEPNARLHLLSTIIVMMAGFYFKLSPVEWCLIVGTIGLVWVTEMLNTAIEKAMDHVAPTIHPHVKIIKDIAAGAVLVASTGAVITGLIIFLPKIF
ncbi:undecaprenol kinase [Chitinophaga skermanii]|uniref:Undecaprenol kinase n=1 Tax=Chitinophaga skermanii TaxID=331697 RepID=A0A327QJV8_9BACT|nr:diacylglycerol kinase family protein [Chitinophaga skermanii]RAJ03962.1 undecaprenol kinase [Chitinophaga skermanii]